VTLDIPGAFMHADMDEIVHMQLDGPMAELLYVWIQINIDLISQQKERVMCYMLN
jgi:hypothetical protein